MPLMRRGPGLVGTAARTAVFRDRRLESDTTVRKTAPLATRTQTIMRVPRLLNPRRIVVCGMSISVQRRPLQLAF